MTSSPHAPDGLTVGDYTLLSRIGEGGMGVVHLARKPGGERVALKVLRPHIVGDHEARSRLAREVSSLSRIRSRWVAEIVDADPWADIPFVATRYVPGLSLHDHVVAEGAITGRDLTWLAGCLAEGLASVHEVGVLHRDVKPSNVLMEGRTPILIDFGLARVADDPRLTHTGWLLGTPGYLAPEILYGDDATAASDVHSWAATVAYAGTGRAPFGRGPSMAIMDRVRRGQFDLDGLDGDLRGVVTAALDPDPERRPTLEAILDWLRPQTTRAHPVVPPPPTAHQTAHQDELTLPLAIAAQAAAEEPTDRFSSERPTTPAPLPASYGGESATRVLPAEWPVDQPVPGDAAQVGRSDPWSDPGADPWAAPERVRVPALERLRRGLLLAGGAVAAGAGAAAYPLVAAAVLLVLTWLLRSGSLTASAHGDRRATRGRRWYDGVLLLLGAPWDLVRSIPGTVVLALWSLGLAIAGTLVCYAVAAGAGTTLFVGGAVFAASLWMGPGGSRVRSPLGRVVNPLAASAQAWGVALLVVLALAGLLGWRVASDGTSWTPAHDRPWSGLHVPGA